MLSRPSHYNSRYKHDLSPRQRDVLELIARGRTNAEIAEALGLTLDGVKWHVREILGKLGLETREVAAGWWREYQRPKARFVRAISSLLGIGLWKTSAGIGGLALSAAAVAGAMSFRGGTGETHADAPPECLAENLRTSTHEERVGDTVRITLEMTLRDPDWYEGFLHSLGRDRHVDSPCLFDREITVKTREFGELEGTPPNGAPKPIVPVADLVTAGSPGELAVRTNLETGTSMMVLVVELAQWCNLEQPAGIEIWIPVSSGTSNSFQGLSLLLAAPDCIVPDGARELRLVPAP